jgi:hypothetical protein
MPLIYGTDKEAPGFCKSVMRETPLSSGLLCRSAKSEAPRPVDLEHLQLYTTGR